MIPWNWKMRRTLGSGRYAIRVDRASGKPMKIGSEVKEPTFAALLCQSSHRVVDKYLKVCSLHTGRVYVAVHVSMKGAAA